MQFREFVADRAAQRTARGHRKEKQRRIGRAGLQIQSPDGGQINKEPGKENPSNIAETKVGERDSPDVLGGEDGAPKNALIGCSNTWTRFFGRAGGSRASNRSSGLNVSQFRRGDPVVLFRSVPGNDVPDDTGSQSYDGAHPKRPPPAVVNHNVGNEKWCGARTYTHAGENQAVGFSPLLGRNPT